MTLVSVPRSALQDLCASVLSKHGVPERHADTILEHLLYAELSGKRSHGLWRLVELAGFIQKGRISKTDGEPSLILDLPSMGLVDGGGGIGLIAADYGTRIAARKARDHGIGLVGIRNYDGTTGCMNFYARALAEQNLVGLIACNSIALVAPPGGRKPVIGTNPIAVSVPGTSSLFIADVTTAAMAYGKIVLAMQNGQSLPDGIVVDTDGNPSNDPQCAPPGFGATLPLEGYKGFSLGLAVELLAGPMIGAKAGFSVPGSDGFLCLAIDPARFVEIGTFKAQVETHFEEIRNAGKAGAVEKIAIPGERSGKTYATNADLENVEISGDTYEKLCSLG